MVQKSPKEELLDRIEETARNYERDYHGCSRCVLLSLQKHLNLGNDLTFQASTPLAGGVAMRGETCGALLGGLLAVGLVTASKEIEDEAIAQAPTHIGHACLTPAGGLKASKIIHAPTMENPAEKTDEHKVKCAMEVALELADKQGFHKIAFPGMGTGVGGLDKKKAAKVMIECIKKFEAKNLEDVLLVDIDEDMVKAWEDEV